MTSEPIDRNKPQGRPSLYGFPDLAVGESVDVPVPTPADVKRMCTNASQYGRRHDRGYRCKTDRQTRVMTITRVR